MSVAVRNGLIIGLALGLFVAWNNWPATGATDAHIYRAIGQVIGATMVVLLIAMLIGRQRAG